MKTEEQKIWDLREDITSEYGNNSTIDGVPIYSEQGLALCGEIMRDEYAHPLYFHEDNKGDIHIKRTGSQDEDYRGSYLQNIIEVACRDQE